MRSLIRQIAGFVLLAQVLCALGLAGATLLHEWRTRLRAFDVRLQGRSDSVLGAIQDAEDPDDNVEVDSRELKLPPEDAFAVYNPDGRRLGASANASAGLTARHADGFRDLRVHDAPYRVLQRQGMRIIDRAETGGVGLQRPVTIVYAAPNGNLWREVLRAASYSLAMIALTASATFVLVLVLLRRALQPLQDLRAAAAGVSFPTLEFAAPDSAQRVKELQPLGRVLEEAVRSLRASFEDEQRFFSNAAHELKTAVAVERSSLQILQLKERTTTEYRDGVERVLQDNERVETLVNQMLRLASAGDRSTSDFPVIDLSTVATETCTRLESVATARGVSLLAQAQPGTPVSLSQENAQTLISNLVMNAIQHSETGGSVEVLVERVADEVRLRILDHGSGIGTAALPRVFDRFYREDASRSRSTGGAGLGLSICRAIVDAACGAITVESEPGHATCFTVTFRIA